MKLPLCSSFLFLLCISLQLGGSSGGASVSKTITVSQSGQGDFSSVQAAVDSVPENNNQWIKILVKAGTYNEKVNIPNTKPYILLEGESDQSVIEFSDHANYVRGDFNSMEYSTEQSATFAAWADNFVARRITFKNMYNGPEGNITGEVAQAVAAIISGDKSALYDCVFVGYQDTLCDKQGRHFFKDCTIQGAVDFIFGFAQSVYEKCNLISMEEPNKGIGYVTAHFREKPDQPTGLVFKNSNVTGRGQTYLGRPWGTYARVLFYNSAMGANVVPQGWAAWGDDGKEEFTTFAEDGCVGPGADKSERVPWMKTLSPEELRRLVSDDIFINANEWVDQQP